MQTDLRSFVRVVALVITAALMVGVVPLTAEELNVYKCDEHTRTNCPGIATCEGEEYMQQSWCGIDCLVRQYQPNGPLIVSASICCNAAKKDKCCVGSPKQEDKASCESSDPEEG